MSFKNKNLSVLAYANGFTMWLYQTDDTVNNVLEDDYFKDGADCLRVGDMIIIVSKKRVGFIKFVICNDPILLSSSN